MNKRLLEFMMVIVLCAATLFGCQNEVPIKSGDSNEISQLKVVTTVFAPYDFARQVVGDKAEVTMLLEPGSETHSYEPTPQDIITIGNADVFIYVGGENDTWVDNVLKSVDNKDLKVVKLLDIVDTVEEETVEGMDVSGEEKEDENAHSETSSEAEVEWDEHVWTSPANAITISEYLCSTFLKMDKKNEASYKSNLASYVEKLQDIDKQFKTIVENGKRKEIVVGDRFPLRYFVEEYGLDYYAAFPGCSGDTEASASTIAFLTDKVMADKIPVIFTIELSNGNIAKSISEATNAKIMTFYSCHNVTKEDFEAGLTYIDFMEKNIEALKEALN